MPPKPKKLVRLPKENLKEAERLLASLRAELQALGREAEALQVEDINRQLEKK